MTDSPVNNPLTRRSPHRLSGRDPESTPHRLSNPVPGSIPHRRTGEGRYPGDGRGNPHNRHPPPTPHFPTTVVPAKAGTQGTGAATTQPSSPTLTGHPPPTVFRRRPEPRGPGSREYLSPILSASNSPLTSSFEPDMTDRAHAQRGPYPETRRHLRRLATSRGGVNFEPYAVYETSATYTSPCESIAIPWGARN